METLLTIEQKKLFSAFSEQQSITPEDRKILEAKQSDKDFDFFHEKSQSNFVKLISLNDHQRMLLKEFLETPIHKIVDRFEYSHELKYCGIASIGDALAIDWVYFPKTCMRREMLKLFHDIIGCELNFVILPTDQQKNN